jgi:hypothetical protein
VTRIVKKIIKRKVSPIPDSVKGLKLEHFNLQDRSEFKVNGPIWFQFHYDNLLGNNIAYGSMGMAIHKWTGSEWKLHDYKSSYGGPRASLKSGGGPGGGPAHEDHWKVDGKGIYALTPYVSFDKEASDKINERNDPDAVGDVSHMAMPTYIGIGQDGPNGKLKEPPAPLFPDKVVEEEIEVEEKTETPNEDAGDEIDAVTGEDAGGTAKERAKEPTDSISGAPDSPAAGALVKPPGTVVPAHATTVEEVSRQVIDWRAGSGVGAVRIVLSRRQGNQWLAHTTLTQALDDNNRVEVIFLKGDGE